jgi:queuine tRNA-ribosyltransferase
MKKDGRTRARLGILKTPHGTIQTPSYVMVATHAKIKALKSSDIKKTDTQVVISNTFHLWDKALANKHDKHLVHTILGSRLPIMTDSGGFQVFSLGAAKEHKVGKVLKRGQHRKAGKSHLEIREEGAYFSIDDQERFLSPELSIEIQEKLGADIIFAFDECTSPLHPLAYNKQAMERTHRWALRCLAKRTRKDQLMFGIVQGGTSKRLRTQSAKYIGSLPFEGFGIGGSFGEDAMASTLATVIPHLPEEKPRHLLGIGRVKDIFIAVESGIDTFDCVIPTREARHGRIWTQKGHYDIRKSKYKKSSKPFETKCGCQACKKATQSKVYALFKAKHPDAGRFATIHNIYFFNALLKKIRDSIQRGTFATLKKQYLR